MYHLTDIPDSEKINFRTLNKDIGLKKMDNGQWDLWFDNGDLVSATEFHSLQVGIIIACLTSWNYMNRYGNPTYEVFGNESYSLLKRNKREDVRFKIRAYFEECLLRMRRVNSVEDLQVHEVKNNPYKYYVTFKVRAMANYLIDGGFEITTETGKSTSFIQYTYNQPYSSLENPLEIHLRLGTEYGGGLENEIIYIYVTTTNKETGEEEEKFYGIKGHTNKDGFISFRIYPEEIDYNAKIRFEYHGNTSFNPCVSEELSFSTIPFHFGVDDDNMLYVTSVLDDIRDYIHLGEIIEDPTITITEPLTWNKIYIAKDNNDEWQAYKNTDEGLVRLDYTVVLKSDSQGNVGELHLFIEDGKIGDKYLYELDNTNNHVYYIGD